MGLDMTAWGLFIAGLINQMGRVMIPAVKTTIMADPVLGGGFKEQVGAWLSAVSLVCLAGKLLGAAVTDKLGGWLVLVVVFALWIVATGGSIVAQSVESLGYLWLLNSFAYTITWGASVQVVGTAYEKDPAAKTANLAFCASASRFGATAGNIVFGQLLTAGFGWRQVLMPMVPIQVVLLLLMISKWLGAKAPAAPKKAAAGKKAEKEEAPPSVLAAFLSIDFWLMLIPKALTFTYTQFFMNYIPQLLHDAYGYDHGMASTLGGVAQGGSIVGLLVVGKYFKALDKGSKVTFVFFELLLCFLIPAALSLGPAVLPTISVVPLLMIWGVAYALPFYIPPGDFAMSVGGKAGTALFTNIFDAAGFATSAVWNPWASAIAKSGDFTQVLYSQALFGAISMIFMPLCMYRVNAKEDAAKKKK